MSFKWWEEGGVFCFWWIKCSFFFYYRVFNMNSNFYISYMLLVYNICIFLKVISKWRYFKVIKILYKNFNYSYLIYYKYILEIIRIIKYLEEFVLILSRVLLLEI